MRGWGEGFGAGVLVLLFLLVLTTILLLLGVLALLSLLRPRLLLVPCYYDYCDYDYYY